MERSLLEFDGEDARAWTQALYVVLAATLVRLLLAALVPLYPDETYYWDWSRHLAAGYFDHPPAIALLIRAGRVIGFSGSSSLSARLFPVLAGGVASLATAAIARTVAGGRAARTAAIIFALMPLSATGLVLATPDAPLLAASAAGLYCVVRALQAPVRSRTSLMWWSCAGIALGVAFASKYTSILLPVTITVAVLARPSLRARLREPGPYVACLAATLVFFPVLEWNAAHDWASFRFQFEHGLGTPARGSAIKRELDLLGGQLGLVSPVIFVLMAHSVWRAIRRPVDDARFALAMVAVGSWVFFVYSALRRSVEPNWPAPSYIAGVVLLAAMNGTLAHTRWLRRGLALAAVLVAIVYVHILHPLLPLRPSRDQTAKNAGWAGVAAKVDSVQAVLALSLPARVWVAGERYQDVSELAFHLREQPITFCACFEGRHNQYELWNGFPFYAKKGDALVLVLDDRSDNDVNKPMLRLADHFAHVRRGDAMPLVRGDDTVSMRRLWILTGARGDWPPRWDEPYSPPARAR